MLRALVARSPFWLVIALLIPFAGLSLSRGIANALGSTNSGRSIDLHSYWGPSRVLLQGRDPYAAVMADDVARYGVGLPGSQDEGLPNNPANTPLMLLVLAPLGLLSWPAARLAWAIINLALALAIPFWAIKLLPFPSSNLLKAGLALVFLAMLPTRNAIGNGQTSLLVLAAMLLAVLVASKNPWIAGVLFGIALSKFTLVLPVLIWFVVYGFYRVSIVAGGLQIAGLASIASISGTKPLHLLSEYLELLSVHTDLLGDLDIPSLVNRLGGPQALGTGAIAAVILVTSAVVVTTIRSQCGKDVGDVPAKQAANRVFLLVLLLMVALPIVYHRAYDAVAIVVLPVGLFGLGALTNRIGEESARYRLVLNGLSIGTLITFGILLLPRFVISPVWPNWAEFYPRITASSAVIAWAISVVIVWSGCQISRIASPVEV